jgi:DNA replication protein
MMMTSFPGFSAGKTAMIDIPEPFFTELLPQIDNLAELKVTLYALWFFNHQEGHIRYIRYADFNDDAGFLRGLDANPDAAQNMLADGLERAIQRNSLLKAESGAEAIFFLNSPRGRAAVTALKDRKWSPDEVQPALVNLAVERPNAFQLYEQNIGPLTPLIADTLREAAESYRPEWIEEAIQIAVEKNVRNWRYIEAILESWQKEGRDGTSRQSSESNREKYLGGGFADIIEH